MALGGEEKTAIEQHPRAYACLKDFLRSQRTLVNSQIRHVSLERIVPPEYQERGIYNIDVFHKVRTRELDDININIGTCQIAVGAGIHAYDDKIKPMVKEAIDSDEKTIQGAKAQLGGALDRDDEYFRLDREIKATDKVLAAEVQLKDKDRIKQELARLKKSLVSTPRGRELKTLEDTEKHCRDLNEALHWLKPELAFPVSPKT